MHRASADAYSFGRRDGLECDCISTAAVGACLCAYLSTRRAAGAGTLRASAHDRPGDARPAAQSTGVVEPDRAERDPRAPQSRVEALCGAARGSQVRRDVATAEEAAAQ